MRKGTVRCRNFIVLRAEQFEKKAKAWLSENKVDYEYRDILKQPLTEEELSELASRAGTNIAALLNPGSNGFKKLDLDFEKISDQQAAGLIYENPKIMRRPLLADEDKVLIGFKPEQYAEIL